MNEFMVVTIFPVLFLMLLFGGGQLFRRKGIDMGGNPPIDPLVFKISKFGIFLPWASMIAYSWHFSALHQEGLGGTKWIALFLWISGFTLLYLGRLGLGESFRIGAPKESTRLKVNGLYRYSRNPMYVGVYATLLASVIYTRSLVILGVALFIVAVHHWIVLSEERFLLNVFGQEFAQYCNRVKRYL